jgi:uncharacterized protein
MSGRRKHCTVAYATPERQYLWEVELPAAASIGAALAAARAQAPAALQASVGWDDLPVGVFGCLRQRCDPCVDGDRIELYRPLQRDPRERRRERVARERGGRRR